jgi:hypothetical protein
MGLLEMRPRRIEIYGATRPQADRRANEDAFLIIREEMSDRIRQMRVRKIDA